MGLGKTCTLKESFKEKNKMKFYLQMKFLKKFNEFDGPGINKIHHLKSTKLNVY